jgi:hypothetical protein
MTEQLNKEREAGTIDVNALERMAKERPDECFLKGSGILKLTSAIRYLEQQNRALLSLSAQPVPSVPEGYVLLPIEPTIEMIVAIEVEIDSQLTASGMLPVDMFRQDGENVYRAMIAAAPQPKEGEA